MAGEVLSTATHEVPDLNERVRALYSLGGNDLGVIAVGDNEGALVMLVDADLPDDLQELLAGADPDARIIAVHDYQLLNAEIGLFDRTASKVEEGQDATEEEREMKLSIAHFVEVEEEKTTKGDKVPNTSWFFDPEVAKAFSRVAGAIEADLEWGEDPDL